MQIKIGKMRAAWRAVARALHEPVCQGTFLGGVIVATVGLGKIYEPFAWIATGLIICMVAARASSTKERK